MYVQLSEVQLATGDTPGALVSSEKAMKMNPQDAGAISAYTRAQVASGDVGKAIATWLEWIKTHPSDAQANALVGSLEESRGNKDQAAIYYKKALQYQPDQPVAANNLAYLMIESGQNLDVALSLAQTARRALPDSPSTADTLGWAFYHKGSYFSARDLFEEALKTAPANVSLHYHLGMTYLKTGDNTNAATHLKKAAALDPNGQVGKDAQKALSGLS
jgi:Flp pilus assembly protein TadD